MTISSDTDDLLLVIVHDVRACLRKNMTSALLLERKAGPGLDPDSRGLLGDVIGAGRELEKLLGAISDFANAAHLAGGKPVPLIAAVHTAISHDPSLNVEVSCDAAVDRDLAVSRGVVRILVELLDNARKFQGGEAPPIRIEISTGGEGVKFVIRDTGIGVAEADSEAVFAPFTRLHPKDTYPGAGLGLAISRRIADSIGATVRIAPNSPRGAVATLLLPHIAP